MRILLVCKGEYRYFFPAIAHSLREQYGATVSAVAFSSPAARMLERTRAFEDVFNLAAWLRERAGASNQEHCLDSLRKLELMPGAVRVNTMVHADRIVSRRSEEQIIATLAGVIEFWEAIWTRKSFDAVIGEVACASEWIGWVTAYARALPYLIPCPTPVANHFFFLDAPNGSWREMEAMFRGLKKRDLSNREASIAEGFLQVFRSQKAKPPFLHWAEHSPLVPEFSRLFRRMARVPFRIQTYVADGKFEIGSHHGTVPWRPVLEDTARILRHVAAEVMMFERQIDPSHPSVYFPLHVQPEFTTDVRAPFFTNQPALVENISKSVPVGYQVLVKEHPGMKGERKLGYYHDLKRLHNVQLLSPSLDSHDLIQMSDAVLTITGSTAWAAILYEKPVIAFGPLCYEFFDLIYKCKNVADLPQVLSEAIERFVPDHELLLKLIWAFLESAHKLEWGDPVRQPQIVEKRNTTKIADAILRELETRAVIRASETMLA